MGYRDSAAPRLNGALASGALDDRFRVIGDRFRVIDDRFRVIDVPVSGTDVRFRVIDVPAGGIGVFGGGIDVLTAHIDVIAAHIDDRRGHIDDPPDHIDDAPDYIGTAADYTGTAPGYTGGAPGFTIGAWESSVVAARMFDGAFWIARALGFLGDDLPRNPRAAASHSAELPLDFRAQAVFLFAQLGGERVAKVLGLEDRTDLDLRLLAGGIGAADASSPKP